MQYFCNNWKRGLLLPEVSMAGYIFPSLLLYSFGFLLEGIPRGSSEPSIDFQVTLWKQGK